MKTSSPYSDYTSALPNRRPDTGHSWWAAALALTLSISLPTLLVAQTDDFNDGDDVGWLRYDPISTQIQLPQNTWTFPSDGYRLQAAPTPNPAGGPGRVGSFRQEMIYDNFHLSVDVLNWNAGLTNAIGMIARVQPTPAFGTLSGYVFGYVTGDNYLALVRVDGERTRGISGSLPFPIVLTAGRGYRLTFTGKGFEMVGNLYDLGDLNTPLATITASDGTYPSGTAGLIAFGVNGGSFGAVDATFDNYSATDRDRPRLLSTLSPFAEVILMWPKFEGSGFILESADSPAADANWGEVTDNIWSDSDNWMHGVSVPVDKKFFRLKKTSVAN